MEEAEEDLGSVVVDDLTIGVGETLRGTELGTTGSLLQLSFSFFVFRI